MHCEWTVYTEQLKQLGYLAHPNQGIYYAMELHIP